jgi:hypothetical protein
MKLLLQRSLCHMVRFARAHMAVGVVLIAAALYVLITGRYENLAARQHTEALLNALALGGLLYTVACWFLYQFVRPLPVAGRCRR